MFLPSHELRQKLSRLSDQVISQNYSLASKIGYEVFGCPLSFVVFHNGTVQSITHIPAYVNNPFHMYHYNGIPISLQPLNDNKLAKVSLPNDVLAVRNKEYTVLSLAQVDHCLLLSDTYYSYFQATRPFSVGSCLSARYLQNYPQMLTHCHLTLLPYIASSWETSKINFLLYFPHSAPKIITCRSQVVANVFFTGLRLVYVPPHCTGNGQNFHILQNFMPVSAATLIQPIFKGFNLLLIRNISSFKDGQFLPTYNHSVLIYDPFLPPSPTPFGHHYVLYMVCFFLGFSLLSLVLCLFCKYHNTCTYILPFR